jgi:hypothetical protein
MSDIFICYRREDSEGYAGRLHDPLADHFGKRAVFIDVDNLHPGVEFEKVIESTLLRSAVVLVIIGPRWIDSRLRNENDYVRREIHAALKGKKRIIPVLVGGARVPSREKLPPELAALAGKNAVTLHHPTWRTDVSRLVASLEKILARRKASSKSTPAAGSGAKSTKKPAAGAKPKARVPKATSSRLVKEATPPALTPKKKHSVRKAKAEQASGTSSSRARTKPSAGRSQATREGSATVPQRQRARGKVSPAQSRANKGATETGTPPRGRGRKT